MKYHPCPHGRREAAALASMNLRAVVGRIGLTYVAPPGPKRGTKREVGARFQPRDRLGRFVTYAYLRNSIVAACARTHTAYGVSCCCEAD